ncbi:hypothetical protein ES705_12942 [subsurface metagenome]
MTKSFCVLCILLIFFTGCAVFRTNTSHVPEIKSIQEPQFPEYTHPVIEEGILNDKLFSELWIHFSLLYFVALLISINLCLHSLDPAFPP